MSEMAFRIKTHNVMFVKCGFSCLNADNIDFEVSVACGLHVSFFLEL